MSFHGARARPNRIYGISTGIIEIIFVDRKADDYGRTEKGLL